MARQPIENLQGYGQTSQSASRPIDAYTGAPAIPQETPGSQLANALGAFSGSVARASARNAAQAKDDQEKITAEKMQSYGAEIVAQGDEFGGQDELASEFPNASTLQKITLAETIGKNKYTQKAAERLTSWLAEDSNLLIDGGYNAFKASLLKEFEEETREHEFLKSGMYQGVNNVFNQYLSNYHKASNLKVKDVWSTEYQASIFHIASNATSPAQIAGLIQLEDEKMHPYKKDPAKMRELTVGNLIQFDLTSGKPPITEQVMALVPWMRSKESEAQLDKAKPEIVAAKMLNLRNRVAEKKLEDDDIMADYQGQINQLSENKDIQGLEKLRASVTGTTGRYAAVHAGIYKATIVAEVSAQVDVKDSLSFAADYESSLVVRAIKGELSEREVLAEINSSTDMREQEKQALRNNLDKIMAGNNLIGADAHNTAFTQRVQKQADLLDNSLLNAFKEITGESFASALRDVWDDSTYALIQEYVETNNEAPKGTALRNIYDKAEAITEAKMDRMRVLVPAQSENQQQQQPESTGDEKPSSAVTDEEGTSVVFDDDGKPVATFLGGDPADESNYKPLVPDVTDEQIEAFKNSGGVGTQEMLEGLSSNAIREAYGDDIRNFVEVSEEREGATEAVANFFLNIIPDYFEESFTKQQKINNLTRQERLVYEKTGKFPENFKD